MTFDYPQMRASNAEVEQVIRYLYSVIERLNVTLDALQTESDGLNTKLEKYKADVVPQIEEYAKYKANKKETRSDIQSLTNAVSLLNSGKASAQEVAAALAAVNLNKADSTAVANLTAAVQSLNAAVTALQTGKANASDVSSAISEVETNIGELESSMNAGFDALKSCTLRRKYAYVNGETGNDSNAGTRSSPYKTLKKALSFYNKGYSDVYITFLGHGDTTQIINGESRYVYKAETDDVDGTVVGIKDFSMPVLHMMGKVDDVTVLWGEAGDAAAFYASHMNWQNINIEIPDYSDESKHYMYFDCCFLSFGNVAFGNFRININCSEFHSSGSTFKRVRCNTSRGNFSNCYFRNNDRNSATISIVNNSDVTLNGTVNVNAEFAAATATQINGLIQICNSKVYMESPITLTGTANNSNTDNKTPSAYLYFCQITGRLDSIQTLANLSLTPSMKTAYSIWATGSEGVKLHNKGNNEVSSWT